MSNETNKRSEWEKLLVKNRAAVKEDLPDGLVELLRRLDEQLGIRTEEAR